MTFAATEPVPADLSWREPNRDVVLTWGTYRTRYSAGVGLIASSIVVPTFTSWSPTFHATGLAIVITGVGGALAAGGFAIVPAPAQRRLIAASVGALAALLLGLTLFFQFYPPPVGGIFVAALLSTAWLAVRQRPSRAYWWVLLTVPFGLLLLGTASVVLIAWIARRIAHRQDRLRREQEQAHQRRVQEVRDWEAAYRDVHGHAPPPPPPPGTLPGPALTPPTAPGTNLWAVAALTFGILGGLVAIVCGHTALRQIQRTGESGRRLALAGLILGYLWLTFYTIYAVVATVIFPELLYPGGR